MSNGKELILKEYAGQKCDVKITIRENGSSYVTFNSVEGYGSPSLEKEELEKLITMMELIKV